MSLWGCLLFLYVVGCERGSPQPTTETQTERQAEASLERQTGESSSETVAEGILQERDLEATGERDIEPLADAHEKTPPDDGLPEEQEAPLESTAENAPDTQAVARCTQETFSHNGIMRLYILCVPDPLPAGALPVVMGFHGGGGNANQWKNALPWEETAAREGFVMVFMQGCQEQSSDCSRLGSYIWNVGKPGETNTVDDQGYTVEVLQRLTTQHSLVIDSKRRFATGHSLGGIFSYSIACDKPDLFAAIGPISATPSDGSCTPHNKTAIVHIHGSDDPNLPFTTGCCTAAQKNSRNAAYLQGCDALPTCFNTRNWWPPVRSGRHPFANVTGLDAMAEIGLGCSLQLQESRRTQSTLCQRYTRCTRLSAEFCVIQGGDHALRGLDQLFDLREHLWSRFSLIR
jgi:polyhydroxybutyrate depolymerase